jgi:chemotaxis protein methyltransferase CheR
MMQTLNLPGTVAYRRGPGNAPLPAPGVQPMVSLQNWTPLVPDPRPEVPAGRPASPRPAKAPPKAAVARAPASPAPRDTDNLLAEIRTRANMGDFAAAAELCRTAIASQSLIAALHFYYGLVLRELGRPDEAEKNFLRSLYLDKNFTMAHYHLGLLLLAEGRSAPGRRSLTHAAQSVSAMDEDRLLDEGDGLTARDLRDLVRLHLDAAPPFKRKA